jgi:hypothetical protein
LLENKKIKIKVIKESLCFFDTLSLILKIEIILLFKKYRNNINNINNILWKNRMWKNRMWINTM